MKELEEPIGELSVEEICKNINNNYFFVPSFQRDFVWDYKKIEQLFDSIYNNYPVSDIILLKITEKEKNLLSYYSIKKELVQSVVFDNAEIPIIDTLESNYCIMDGQQRLTSIYVGIYGKFKCKKIDGVNMVLCFNLLSSNGEDIFEYRKDDDYDVFENKLWVEVRYLHENFDTDKILKHALKKYKKDDAKKLIYDNSENYKKSKYSKRYQTLISNIEKNNELIRQNIAKFHEAFKINKSLVYNVISLKDYKTDEEKSNALYEMFLRLNSGGKPLSPAELLYSKIDISIGNNEFKTRDKFKEYLNELNELNNDGKPTFSFSVDFLMRSLWYIFGKSTFKAFMMSDIKEYCNEEKFKKVVKSIKKAKEYYKLSGFEARNMSYNTLLPIAYYDYYNGKYDENISKEIAKYFSVSVAIGYFGSSSDSALMKMRKVLKNGEDNNIGLFKDKEFDFKCFQEAMLKETEDDKLKFVVGNGDIDNMLKSNYENNYNHARNVLFLISKWINTSKTNTVYYDEDHIHPQKFRDIDEYKKVVGDEHFNEEEYKFFCDNYNNIANLQILDKQSNSAEKNGNSLIAWYKSQQPESIKAQLERSFIEFDDVEELELYNFKKFFNKRKELLKKKLCELFGVEYKKD